MLEPHTEFSKMKSTPHLEKILPYEYFSYQGSIDKGCHLVNSFHIKYIQLPPPTLFNWAEQNSVCANALFFFILSGLAAREGLTSPNDGCPRPLDWELGAIFYTLTVSLSYL
jgi:hypothetical protein